ncbi:MAG: nitroreductase family protein [Prochlorotrichaceae cyanobacterium]
MNTLDAIQQRRSVKHYDASHQMSEAEIQQLMELAILSPTSFNMQNWRFVVVTDPELRQALRTAAWNQAQVTDASITLLLCADLKAALKEPGRYWKDAAPEAQEKIVPMISGFYQDKDQLQRDEAMRSCGIAAQTVMLAAKAMGYDTCAMIGFDAKKVAEIINLPEDHVIGLMITVGKAVKPAQPRPGQLPLEEVVIRNKFS